MWWAYIRGGGLIVGGLRYAHKVKVSSLIIAASP